MFYRAFSMGALKGLHIIITRPAALAKPLHTQLLQLGARATLLPLLKFKAYSTDEKIQAFFLQLAPLTQVIFTSKTAVSYSLAALSNLPAPHRLKWLAIGQSTAQALEQGGIKPVHYPQPPYSSEQLLKHPLLSRLPLTVAIIRGTVTRPYLGQCLRQKGATVLELPVYQPCASLLPIEKWQQALLVQPTVIVITCERSLDQVLNMPLPAETTLLVISPHLARKAEAYKNLPIIESEGASDAAIIARLVKWWHDKHSPHWE